MGIEIYKFGGASVKDADAIKNLTKIIREQPDCKKIIVISAMGKTTNALEDVVHYYLQHDEKYLQYIREIREYHLMVSEQLLGFDHTIKYKLFALFDKIEAFCSANTSSLYGFIYDQIISIGELASTTIVSEYLKSEGIANAWLDARQVICTDNHYTDAKIDWEKTAEAVLKNQIIAENHLIITQGFIGATTEQNTTTLGREGSDFSAAIFANVLSAEKLTIWKDVKGVYNCDPNMYYNAVFIEKLSFKEATEMTYYGAKVIHPKTIRPLQNANIPLEVRSFIDFKQRGTLIYKPTDVIYYPAIIVKKEQQVLLSFTSKDFSFTEAENLRMILKSCDKNRLKINIIQTGALSTSIVVDEKNEKIEQIKRDLVSFFDVKFNTDLTLITIRHYQNIVDNDFVKDKEILLEQKTRETVQFLVR